MKQHITVENLMELNEYQRDRLNSLWNPVRYDLAAGFLCKDAENNEYDIFPFVIGYVNIRETRSGYSMTLMNLEALRSWRVQEEEAQEETGEETGAEEEFSEEDFVFEYERPDIYNKEDCLPLLNIGQMIDILSKCAYGKGNFYINLRKDSKDCSIGRNIEEYIDYGTDYNGEELCDVLWTAIKEAL